MQKYAFVSGFCSLIYAPQRLRADRSHAPAPVIPPGQRQCAELGAARGAFAQQPENVARRLQYAAAQARRGAVVLAIEIKAVAEHIIIPQR